MAIKKFYLGTFGPFEYDDTDDINDSDFPGEQFEAVKTNGTLTPSSSADVTALTGRVNTLESWQGTGVSGSFTTVDGKTVTVTAGLITGIV